MTHDELQKIRMNIRRRILNFAPMDKWMTESEVNMRRFKLAVEKGILIKGLDETIKMDGTTQ